MPRLFEIEIIEPGFSRMYSLYKEKFSPTIPHAKKEQKASSHIISLELLHPEIFSKCNSLYSKKEYAEAVEKGFKVVKDKLRDLTGFEKGTDAFGKTKLHIKGAAADNVDGDFNKAVQYLTMSIDMFKNEKGHTSDAKIDDPMRAYEYLCLSSLAMHLLDNAEIK